jgi:hypothetical protein
LIIEEKLISVPVTLSAGSREGLSQESFEFTSLNLLRFATKRARQKLAPSLLSIFYDIHFLQKNLFLQLAHFISYVPASEAI